MTRTDNSSTPTSAGAAEDIGIKIVNKQHDGAKYDIASGITHPVTNLFLY